MRLGEQLKILFGNLKERYKSAYGDIYISEDAYEDTGMHIGVLPPYKNKIFSEYLLGNKIDAKRLWIFLGVGVSEVSIAVCVQLQKKITILN